MSTQLGLVSGKEEVPYTPDRTSTYNDIDMSVTSFYGGVNRGRCIQLTIHYSDFIQLDEAGVSTLIGLLSVWEKEGHRE